MPGPWVSRPPLNTARFGLDSAVSQDGVIYAVGGYGDHFQPIHASVERRDPVTEEWTFVEPMSMPRGNPGAAAVGNRIFVVGGFRQAGAVTNTGESFDPLTNEWTPIERHRGPISGPGATAHDGRIYLIGGGPGAAITNSVGVYDSTTDTWSYQRSPMPTPRFLLRAVTLEGQIYAVGGAVGNGQPFSKALERYDPIPDTWTELHPMSVGRGNPGVAVSADGRRIIVVGGAGGVLGNAEGLDSVEVYDTLADSWTPSPQPLPVGRGSLSAERPIQSDDVLAIGGALTGGIALARVESRLI